MSFDESVVSRDNTGQFSKRRGTSAEISLPDKGSSRACTSCGVDKPLSDFPKKPSGEPRKKCKECRNAYMREYYRRPEVNSAHKERVRSNPNRANIRKKAIAKVYGFASAEEHAAFKDMHPKTCPICEQSPAVVTDHDHATGEPRGQLCSNCNVALGFMADDPERLMRAAKYLKDAASKRQGA